MARVSCSHHVLGVEHLLRELGHRARSVLRVAPAVEKSFVIAKSDFCWRAKEYGVDWLVPGDQRSKARHEEMKPERVQLVMHNPYL